MADEITGHLLEQISHLHTLLGMQFQGVPKTASTITYGPDGETEAKQINANYQGVTFDDKGTIVGGSLQYSAQAQGTKLSDSTATFTNGKPASVTSIIFDRRGSDAYRAVNADLSDLVWTNTNRIKGGEVKITAAKQNSNTIVVGGAISYTNEQLAQINLTHYAQDASGDVHGYTAMNYANTEFLGDEIVGGYLLMTTQRQDRTLSSQSKLSYASNGLPITMETSGYAANGTDLNSTTLTDYTSVVFDARRNILSGTLHITTKNIQGIVREKTAVIFAHGVPQTTETQNFSNKSVLLFVIKTDYTGGKFNNSNHVVSSTINVKTFRPDKSLISSAQVQYDDDGNLAQHLITNYGVNGQEVSHTQVHYAEATFDHNRKVIKGQVKTETKTADGTQKVLTVRHYNGARQYTLKETTVQDASTEAVQKTTKTIKRPDGTLAEVITQLTPQTASITQYATDGKTVIKSFQIDYSHATLENNSIVGGNVAISASDPRQRLLSKSQLNYFGDSPHNNIGRELIPLKIVNQTNQDNLYFYLVGTIDSTTPEHNWYYLSDVNGNVTQCIPTNETTYSMQLQNEQTIQLPRLSSIRMYFSFGNPLSILVGDNGIPNSAVGWVKDANFQTLFDWVEIDWSVNSPTDSTVGLSATQADMFGLPFALELIGSDANGQPLTQQGGFSAAGVRNKIISIFKNASTPWNKLVISDETTGLDLRVISPEHGAEDQMGLFPKNQQINQNNLYIQTIQQYLPNGGTIVVHNPQFAQITLLGF